MFNNNNDSLKKKNEKDLSNYKSSSSLNKPKPKNKMQINETSKELDQSNNSNDHNGIGKKIGKVIGRRTLKDLFENSIKFKVFIILFMIMAFWYLFVLSGLKAFFVRIAIATIPFIVGFLLALLPHPMTLKMQRFFNNRNRKKFAKKGQEFVINPRKNLIKSGLIIFMINIVLLGALFYLIGPLVVNQSSAFLQTLLSDDFKLRLVDFLKNTLNFQNITLTTVNGWYSAAESWISTWFSANGFNMIKAVGAGLMSVLMGFAIGFYLIFDWTNYSEAVMEALPNRTKNQKSESKKLKKEVRITLVGWGKGFVLDQLFIFSLTAILLYFIGVQQWFVLALIMVLLNMVPFIGPIIGGIIITAFLIVNYINVDGLHMHPHMNYGMPSLWIIGLGVFGAFAIQTVESVWWVPFVYNRSLSIHPATILIVLGAVGIIWSPFLLPLTIPSIAVFKTIYMHKTGRELRI